MFFVSGLSEDLRFLMHVIVLMGPLLTLVATFCVDVRKHEAVVVKERLHEANGMVIDLRNNNCDCLAGSNCNVSSSAHFTNFLIYFVFASLLSDCHYSQRPTYLHTASGY